MECIHTIKEKEYLRQRKERETCPKTGILWIIFYWVEDKLINLANKVILNGKELKFAILGMLFMIGDILSTHTFLFFNLGEEGNYLPARFYDAGLALEFEFMKILYVGFLISFFYITATRGWTNAERASGKIGLLTSCIIFGGVVIWNVSMMILNII